MPDIPDLPMILPGHAPLDVCHKSSSGVAVHLSPGCECGVPTQMVDITDRDGNVIGEHEVAVPGHVNISDGGKMRSMPLEQARNAGLIV